MAQNPFHGATLPLAAGRWLTTQIVVQPDGQIWWWDGVALHAVELLGWWDGTTVQTAEVLGWWDGSQIQPLATS